MSLAKRLRCFLLLAGLLAAVAAWAQEGMQPFVVRHFKVEGAQRISEGTIYNYLPINIGDMVTEQRVAEAIRALYATGFFRDVELRRDGDTLVIAVLERPSIEDFTFSGNHDIKTDDLKKSLNEVGLAQGKIFDRSVLDQVTQYLTEQYYARGKYAAKIDPKVVPLPDNRVRVAIKIEEGDRAKIRAINIIGNTQFSDKELLGQFKLKTGGLMAKIKSENRYSKESLKGDLETLRSYYMDRGFADFQIQDAHVAISPDKRDIFITISLSEGERYKISNVKLAGNMVVPEKDLRALIFAQPGQIFSQQILTATEDAMKARLGLDGYAFADVQAVPDLDRKTKQVAVTFFVQPKNRVYVRRITFEGTSNVNDEVYRREIRQLEGGYLSNALLERSKVRLERLPYVKSADYDTNPVPGSPDLVDVDFNIKERQAGQFGGSIGYSKYYGIMLGGNLAHSNFLGTGNRVAINLSGGQYYKVYSLSFTNPYRTINALSRTMSLSYQNYKAYTSATSPLSTTQLSAGLNWGYPISELQTLQFGFALQKSDLLTSSLSSAQAAQWVQENGHPFVADAANGVYGSRSSALQAVLGWNRNSLNRSLFPDLGSKLSLGLTTTVPGSDIEYYVASLDFTKYVKLFGRWRFKIHSINEIAKAYGNTTAPPPYVNFYGGGANSVRGFKESYLGPRDSLGYPAGGNMLIADQFELVVPTPKKFAGSARLSLFYDIGNVFETGNTKFYDKLGDPIDYSFSYDRLKRSVGVAVEWLAPLGLLRFSYASPLNADATTDRFYGDQVERFQFSVGQAF